LTQVFVSYARSDKRQVGKLITALRKARFETWWDDDIPPGASWEGTIERALADAGAVIVCWSPRSISSENVRSEARLAKARGRLVQVFIAPCESPLFFGEQQGIDLTRWKGSPSSVEFNRLTLALRQALERPQGSSRPEPTSKQRSRWRPVTASIATALAILVLGVWALHSLAPPAHAANKIAVVPLEGLGGGATSASIADGATDQVRASLDEAHIPTISRLDSEGLKAGDADGKLSHLGVGYIVSGTVQASGPTLHARLHLDDSVRHASLWSYEVKGSSSDPVALDYAVGRAIARVISCSYRGLAPGGLTDSELLSRYLRVCDLFVNNRSATDPKATDELLSDLRLITTKAPAFAPAHSDLAKFSAYLAPLMPPAQAAAARAGAAREATRALQLDPHSSDAWLAREMLLPPTYWAKREAILRKGVSVDPDWPHTNGFLAELLTETGRMREAAAYAQRAAAADFQMDWQSVGASLACAAGSSEPIIAELKERQSVSPGDPTIKTALRWCFLDSLDFRGAKALETPVQSGTVSIDAFRQAVEEARITGKAGDRVKALQLEAALAADPAAQENGRPITADIIEWSAALGDVDTAFRLADRYSPGHPLTGLTLFLFAPPTEPMRRDPRFYDLVNRYGLLDFWRSTGRWPDFCSGADARLPVCRKS
jgi:TolB-like protein